MCDVGNYGNPNLQLDKAKNMHDFSVADSAHGEQVRVFHFTSSWLCN